MVSLGQEKFREGKEIGPNLDFCVGLEWEERKGYAALVSTTSFPIHNSFWGFPGGSVVKKSAVNAGDASSIPRLGRSDVLRSN